MINYNIFLLLLLYLVACSFVVKVEAKKKHELIGGFYLQSLFGLLLAIKVKVVLVILAVWGGIILTVKVLLALAWPFISKWSRSCPFKDHHHGHEVEFDPSFFKHANFEDGSAAPSPEYLAYKQWNRRQSYNATYSGHR